MSHFTRTHTTGVWTVGGAGFYVLLPADLEDLSNKVFGSLNGDEGGCWAPSSQIVIDTGGMLFSTAATVNYGGSLKTGTNSRFVLGGGASDWPKLGANHVGRTVTRRSDLKARMSDPRLHWCDSPSYPGSIQTIACTVNGASGLEQPKCAIPLRVHNGARLVGATLTFRVNVPRTVVPVQMPKMRLVRQNADGVLVPMTSVAAGADLEGWVSVPKVTTGSAWYAAGNAQTFEVPCDQNNTIDTSLYLYWAQLQEEVGTAVVLPAGKSDGAIIRERKATVGKVFTTHVSVLNGTGGPGGVTDGEPVLLVGQLPGFAYLNGLWIAHTGGGVWWRRRGDMARAVDCGPGFLVPDSSTWEVWECTTPVFGQSITIVEVDPALDPGTGPRTEIQFQRRQPRGNIYHSLACRFDSIADLRPQ